MGMIEFIFPVFIGTVKKNGEEIYQRFRQSCFSDVLDVCVQENKSKLFLHLDRQALGSPMHPSLTIRQTVDLITAHQGAFLEGRFEESFQEIINKITSLSADNKGFSRKMSWTNNRRINGSFRIISSDIGMDDLLRENIEKDKRIEELLEQIQVLENDLKSVNTSSGIFSGFLVNIFPSSSSTTTKEHMKEDTTMKRKSEMRISSTVSNEGSNVSNPIPRTPQEFSFCFRF
jgi:hypothetical protein